MAKIKKTKTVLKAQRDALGRYQRYLPTLELKKMQLKVEVNHVKATINAKRAEKIHMIQEYSAWVRLFSEAETWNMQDFLRVKTMERGTDNIAGVTIPALKQLEFERMVPDLFATPPWIDDGLDALERLIRIEIEERLLREALALLSEELRITSQRVNLFEKVKIPECKENIRIIKIVMGDAQIAAVARAKVAKSKISELESAAE